MQELAINLVQDRKPLDVDREARNLYSQARRRARPTGPRRLFGRRSRPLLRLAEAERDAPALARRFAGVQCVPLRQIRGSEGRQEDFDADFHPLGSATAARWMSVARAFLLGLSLPPVELIQLGETYYVRDGHHRISVAAAVGQSHIEATVTVYVAMG